MGMATTSATMNSQSMACTSFPIPPILLECHAHSQPRVCLVDGGKSGHAQGKPKKGVSAVFVASLTSKTKGYTAWAREASAVMLVCPCRKLPWPDCQVGIYAYWVGEFS